MSLHQTVEGRLQGNAMQCTIRPCGLLAVQKVDMSKENITFRLNGEKRVALDVIAASMDRDRSYVLNEAIDIYLEMHQWQLKEIHKGIAEAEAGDFASDNEVQAVFEKLTQAPDGTRDKSLSVLPEA